MHCKIITIALCALALPASISARPAAPALARRNVHAATPLTHPITLRRRNQRAEVEQAKVEAPAKAEPAAGDEAAAGEKEAAAGEGKEAAAGEEENAANEVEIESAFAVAVPLEGGDLKQDIVFTPSTVGKFEFEFQNNDADECTVTENAGAAAAAPPAGFEAIEPNSYTVALAVSKGAGLTLSKIDYIFDAASAGLVGKDVTGAKVGKFCTEAGAFVIADNLGELEFELEENEVTLNLNKNVTSEGEWGIFLPVAAAAAGNVTEGIAGAANGTAEQDKAALEAAEKERLAAEEKQKLAAAEEEKKAKAEQEKKAMEQAKAEQEKMAKAKAEAAKKAMEQAKAAAEAEKKAMEEQKKMAAAAAAQAAGMAHPAKVMA